ncbi:hypothetical protein C2E25_08000 [Geothermobacter hydrogeniphilus]|uniref:DUF3592 domain-containing protein n=1 Tax=Geothermobacter hydrogeniphilus TaxID=1969733 RepID=A0A2K2HAL8_9BACT|nr:hypothetical protein [Geothermobacter hydrogeniphilus]PNU20356.1 hypothetical protein C2E25_08000 [Geothermobacter hydrogeniphilus]
MLFITVILILPILYLLVRVYLILRNNLWGTADANILKFTMKKRNFGIVSESSENAQNNYIDVLYEFTENGKTYVSKRISLSLLDRQYSKVEIDHDPFLDVLRSGRCKIYYLKKFPKISVIKKDKYDCYSNLMLLSIYVFVVVTSYVIVLFIS